MTTQTINDSVTTAANVGITMTPNDQPDANAAAAVQEVIAAGNYPVNGVVFEPFRVKVASLSSFTPIWSSHKGTHITFYSFSDGSTGELLPLGDVLALNNSGVLTGGALLLAPSPSAEQVRALAHPTGFTRILDDSGSGNSNDITYWRLNPPSGYVALGICFNAGTPNPANYWCVKQDYVQAVTTAGVWNDSHQGFDDNGNVNAPAFSNPPETAPPGQILLLPTTFLSDQDGGNETPFALKVKQAMLPVQTIPTPDPPFDPNITSGATTDFGLTAVAILPYTAVAGDADFPDQASNSPFYFVAAEPYWLCTSSRSTPEGGSETISVTIGVSQTDSTTFQETTSMTVSAEIGAAFDGVSGKVSASYTKTFQLTTATSTTHDTQVTKSVTIGIPKQPITWFWARQTQIAVFRSDGSQITPVSYGDKDQRFIPDTVGLRRAEHE